MGKQEYANGRTIRVFTVPSGFCYRIIDCFVESLQQLRYAQNATEVCLHFVYGVDFGLCGRVDRGPLPHSRSQGDIYTTRETALTPRAFPASVFVCRRRMERKGASFRWMEMWLYLDEEYAPRSHTYM